MKNKEEIKILVSEKTIAHSNWAEHGMCELHVKK